MTDCKIAISEVYRIRGKIPYSHSVLLDANKVVNDIVPVEFFTDAPFKRVCVIVCYGEHTDWIPQVFRKSNEWIEFTVDMELAKLKKLSRGDLLVSMCFYVITSLILLGKQYHLDTEQLVVRRRDFSVLSDSTALDVSTDAQTLD